MTKGQRKVHVLLWLILGPIALVGLLLALQWRPPKPLQSGDLPGVVDSVEGNQQEDSAGVGGRP